MREAEKRLLDAVSKLLQEVTAGNVCPKSAALCIENSLSAMETTLEPGVAELLAKPVSSLGALSVRVRKVLQRIPVRTVGELTAKSADELLLCNHFGVTCLYEVEALLATHNLKLRDE